jgi:hypothetical protein
MPACSSPQVVNANPAMEHSLYLVLFVTNSGGW